jgi:hypothetical protein
MAIMMGKLYAALRASSDVPDDLAREAAEEVAAFENRIAEIRADLTLVKWMIGFNLAMTVPILWRVFAQH